MVRFDALLATNFLPPPTRSDAVVLVVHDLAFEVMPEAGPGFGERWRRRFDGWLRRSAGVIVPSASAKADLLRRHRVDEGRVPVIPHGADTFEAPAADEVERVRAGFGIGGPFALFVGGIEPRKNLGDARRRVRAPRRPGAVARDRRRPNVLGPAGHRDGASAGRGAPRTRSAAGRVHRLRVGRREARAAGRRDRARVPVAVRGVRVPGARGVLGRRPGADVVRGLAARGGRRRRAPGGPERRRRDRRGSRPALRRPGPARAARRRRPRASRDVLVGAGGRRDGRGAPGRRRPFGRAR